MIDYQDTIRGSRNPQCGGSSDSERELAREAMIERAIAHVADGEVLDRAICRYWAADLPAELEIRDLDPQDWRDIIDEALERCGVAA